MQGLEDDKPLRALATRIREELEITASRMHRQHAPPPWVATYICQDAVEQVLCGVHGVLRELKLTEATLLQIPGHELAPHWIHFLQSANGTSHRSAPHIVDLQHNTIRAVAAAAHAAVKQRSRNQHFSQFGAPQGVAAFPALASLEKSKLLPQPLALSGNPAVLSQMRYQQYISGTTANRRKPNARSLGGRALPADTTSPELYN